MAYKRTSQRIKLAFAVFGITLTLVLGFSLISTLKSAESRIIDDTLRAELAYFRRNADVVNAPESFVSRTTTIFVILPDATGNAPEYLANLPAGAHDVSFDTKHYRVLVTEQNNVRYIVQYDDTDIRSLERQFINMVVVISGATLLVSLAVGWLLARRVSGPLTRLANDVVRFENDPAHQIDTASYHFDEIGFLARRIRSYHEKLAQSQAQE